ncbi:MAG: hypothetical protein ACHREM_17785 [Polyangiales bacterium]
MTVCAADEPPAPGPRVPYPPTMPRGPHALGLLTRAAIASSIALAASAARAEDRASLDDFYERGRLRADPFESCDGGGCERGRVVAVHVGASLADPVFSDGTRHLATALHGSLDVAFAWGRGDVLRSIAEGEVYRSTDDGRLLADLTLDTAVFHVLGRAEGPGLHFMLNPRIVERGVIDPHDLADLQLRPYRLYDVEAEVAPVGPKIDKDASLALPIGVALRRRWDDSGDRLEDRFALSGALAFRGFPKALMHHDQLDVARLTRTWWTTSIGDATGWTASAGYQRLSPDLAGIDLWILVGYGWYHAANDAQGAVAQLGAEVQIDREVSASLAFDRHYSLDRRNNNFAGVDDVRASVQVSKQWLRASLGYELVTVYGAAAQAIAPQLAWVHDGLTVGARYRLTVSGNQDVTGAAFVDRFEVSVDEAF